MLEEEDADDRADQQGLRAGVGAVVDARRVLARHVENGHQRRRRHDHQPARDEQHLQRAAPPQQEAHDERPHEIELLFDRQRPHVAQRRRLRELVEVGLAGEDEAPVRDVAEGGDRVAADAVELAGSREHSGVHDDADHHEEQRGQQPLRPPHPEPLEIDAPAVRPLGDEQGRDEEAAQDEEGVDAQVPPDRPALTGVVEEHRRDREGADAVERRLVPEVGRATAARPRRSPRGRRVGRPGAPPPPQQGVRRYRAGCRRAFEPVPSPPAIGSGRSGQQRGQRTRPPWHRVVQRSAE